MSALLTNYFVPVTSIESLAALLFNGFVTIFLLPMLVMDLCYYLPAALGHLALGKARLRILVSALRGLVLWLLCVGAAVGALHLLMPRALTLLLYTYGGMTGALAGMLHTFSIFFRYRGNMRAYYYAQVLEKNLSSRQAKRYEALWERLRSGEADPEQLKQGKRMDYLSRRIVEDFIAQRDGTAGLETRRLERASIRFL